MKNFLRKTLIVGLSVVVALLAAEGVMMLFLALFLSREPSLSLLAGLLTVPLWALFVTLIYVAQRPWRCIGLLTGLALLCGLLIFWIR